MLDVGEIREGGKNPKAFGEEALLFMGSSSVCVSIRCVKASKV